jgi:hypothetical protein
VSHPGLLVGQDRPRQLAGLGDTYRIDARFPAWVIAEEEDPASLRDPHTLPASTPARSARPPVAPKLLLGLLMLLAIVAVVVLAVSVRFSPV